MVRRPIEPPREPELTPQQLRLRIEQLERCIAGIEAFDPETVNRRSGEPQVVALRASIEDSLSAAFGHGTPSYNRYSGVAVLDRGPHFVRTGGSWGRGPQIDYEAQDRADARRYLAEGKARSVALLQQSVRTLQDRLQESEQLNIADVPNSQAFSSRRIFIVHGHDVEARETVARFLALIGFEPIILHEQANQGRTVIEKIEAHGDVGFAIVLLTPDDLGKARDDEQLRTRARQNVLLELGYFIGRLGRPRVCALMRGNVEVPSDFLGVVWQPIDAAGGWKQALGQELAASGYEVDFNRIMRPRT